MIFFYNSYNWTGFLFNIIEESSYICLMPGHASWGHASLCSNVISQNPVNVHTQGGNYFALLGMNMDMHMSGITDMLLASKTS